jgi:hypothetical protein
MKKLAILFVFCLISFQLLAQLRVNDYGDVSIGYDPYVVNSSLFLGKPYFPYQADPALGAWGIEALHEGINFWKPHPNPFSGNYFLHISIYGLGVGKIATPGISLDAVSSINTDGEYYSSSDARLKTDIQDLAVNDKLYRLQAKSYKKIIPCYTDSIDAAKGFPPKTEKEQKTLDGYGFLAQELRELFPELVRENDKGYLSVNYIGLIPVVVEVVKEHKQALDAQAKKIKELEAVLNKLTGESELRLSAFEQNETGLNQLNPGMPSAFLYQNAPNPFREKTQIRYYLPDGVSSAEIHIFNMQGALIKSIPANGSGSVDLFGSDLQAGMYLYSLVADGLLVDTKRMLLTK